MIEVFFPVSSFGLKSCCYRYFAIPMLLLLGCIGFFVMSEYRTISGGDSVKDLIGDKDLALTVALEHSVFATPFFPENERKIEDLRAGLSAASEKADVLLNNLFDHVGTPGKHADILRRLRDLSSSIEDLLILVEKNELFGSDIAQDLSKAIKRTHKTTREFTDTVFKEHAFETEMLLKKIETDRKERGLLVVFVLFSGCGLVIMLLNAVRHYKENAERAQEAEKVNALFASALQSTKVGVLIRDMRAPGSPVVFVNNAFKEMTGYDLADIPEGEVEFLFGWKTDPAAISAFRRALSLRESATFNVMVYRKDGAPFWSEWHLSPILGQDGDVVSFVSLFTDMTLFRQTKDDLVQAKNLAERASAIKTNFLAMMSHEIRTPINGIQGVLRLMEETALDSDQRGLLSIAMSSSQALHRIINDILDYAKMEAGKIEILSETFELKKMFDEIEGLVRPLVGKKPVQLIMDVAPNLPESFIGDSGRIRQILINLIGNALKFTNEGSVRVRAASLMEHAVDERAGLLVRFEVQDTGIGIAPSDQERLFKEFTQIEPSRMRHFGGTGLGLAICKRLIGMMGGEIGVESQPEKGSKFWFMLPLEIAERFDVSDDGSCDLATTSINRLPRECIILLAEDNDTNRLVARRYLQKAGFIVEEAVNGAQAVAMAKEKNYDMIFMDVSMPEMDGLIATRHLRACEGHNASVPIIALTAHVMSGDRETCIAAGMNDHLTKPIEYPLLVNAIKRWLQIDVVSAPVAVLESAKPSKGASEEVPAQEKSPAMPAAPLVSSPDFDPRPLERLRADLGRAAVREIVDTFIKDSPRRVAGLSSHDLEEVRSSAHTLKSSGANCGLLRFSQAMAEIEKMAAKGARDQIDQALDPARGFYDSGMNQLRTYRESFVE